MTDVELTARLRANLAAFKEYQCGAGVMRSWRAPGVVALALPGRADTLFQQQVVSDDARALARALPALEAWYRAQAVPAWRIAAAPGDLASERLLKDLGYTRGDRMPHMALALPPRPPPPLPPGTTLERTDIFPAVLELNALCYGHANMAFIEAWRTRPPPAGPVHAVLLREAGRALACALSFEQDAIAGIYLVATHPDARRRGLGAQVMKALHADALARGRTHAVLQSSASGQGLYQRLGYRDLGDWEDWISPPPGAVVVRRY